MSNIFEKFGHKTKEYPHAKSRHNIFICGQ